MTTVLITVVNFLLPEGVATTDIGAGGKNGPPFVVERPKRPEASALALTRGLA